MNSSTKRLLWHFVSPSRLTSNSDDKMLILSLQGVLTTYRRMRQWKNGKVTDFPFWPSKRSHNTVWGAIFRTSAVSSTLNQPKKRNSTTRAFLSGHHRRLNKGL